MHQTYSIHESDMISFSGYDNLPYGGITDGIFYLGDAIPSRQSPKKTFQKIWLNWYQNYTVFSWSMSSYSAKL